MVLYDDRPMRYPLHHDNSITSTVNISILNDRFFRPFPHFAVETMLKRCKRRKRSCNTSLTLKEYLGGCGSDVVRLLTFHQGERGSYPGAVAPEFSYVGIVPDDAAGLWVSSRISHFPPLHPYCVPYPPKFTLIGSQVSMLRCAQISTHFSSLLSLFSDEKSLASESDDKAPVSVWRCPADPQLASTLDTSRRTHSVVAYQSGASTSGGMAEGAPLIRPLIYSNQACPEFFLLPVIKTPENPPPRCVIKHRRRTPPARLSAESTTGGEFNNNATATPITAAVRASVPSPHECAVRCTRDSPTKVTSSRLRSVITSYSLGSTILNCLNGRLKNSCNSYYLYVFILYLGGATVANALASHQGDPGSIPGGFTPGYSHVGMVPEDAACRRVFSGYFRFPRLYIPVPLHPRVSFHAMFRDDGHLPVPAGKPITRREVRFVVDGLGSGGLRKEGERNTAAPKPITWEGRTGQEKGSYSRPAVNKTTPYTLGVTASRQQMSGGAGDGLPPLLCHPVPRLRCVYELDTVAPNNIY
ncbi:hypothetical protein PR048_008851 [Dryococelus australis]|uniref:Uncharacterized protein n=1 Tax=Dryococelus australis TaxID=614101 RepID=A0ABQ9HY91_9NEOP|nr:hypothetical protein PR048_008851 [Dryococelus australis]